MLKSILISLSLLFAFPILAQSHNISKLSKILTEVMPNQNPDSITISPLPGLYEVVYGSDVFYASEDGKYVVKGDIFNISEHENLTENRRSEGRLREVGAIDEANMIVFSPKETKRTITVFYDVDCAFCKKMQNDMSEINKNNIEIRYLSFPRAGVGSPAYNKAVWAWCAKDRKQALERIESDQPVEQKTCDNPVKEQYELGKRLGVMGTPTLLLENGQLIVGYFSVMDLLKTLDSKK